VLYNIAGCHRELSRYAEAVKFYTRFLAEGVGKVPPNRLADAQKELDGIFALVARVTVKVEPAAGATLFLDGAQLGPLPLDMPLILPPGEHQLRARAPGRPDAERGLRLASGDELLVELAFPAPAPKDAPPTTGPNDPTPPSPTGPAVALRPGPETELRAGGAPADRRGAGRFAVGAGFGTNALRAGETGVPSVGIGVALGSRLELGVDATLVAYAVMPSVRVRVAGEGLSLHAIAAAPIAFTDGDARETFVAAAAGLGLRLRLPGMPIALRLESYASYAGKTHGTTVPTFLGGELWF
jgi:hypothetical protein